MTLSVMLYRTLEECYLNKTFYVSFFCILKLAQKNLQSLSGISMRNVNVSSFV